MTCPVKIARGKFHGLIQTKIPRGSSDTNVILTCRAGKLDAFFCQNVAPLCGVIAAKVNGFTYLGFGIGNGFAGFDDKIGNQSTFCASNAAAIFSNMLARCSTGMIDHFSKAVFDFWKTCSMSPRFVSLISSCFMCGFRLSIEMDICSSWVKSDRSVPDELLRRLNIWEGQRDFRVTVRRRIFNLPDWIFNQMGGQC